MKENFKRALGLGATATLMSMFMIGPALAAPNDDAILMSVNGSEYVSETTSPIIMALNPDKPNEPSVIVPGDLLKGSLTVKNNGPDKGVLKAYLIDVENNGPEDLTMDDWFTGDVQITANNRSNSLIHWDSTSEGGKATSIKGTEHEGIKILEQNLNKNGTTEIDLAIEFPVEAVSGNSAGDNAAPNGIPNDYAPGKRSSSFDIYLTLEGDTSSENPTPPSKPTPDPNEPTDNPSESPIVVPTPDSGNNDSEDKKTDKDSMAPASPDRNDNDGDSSKDPKRDKEDRKDQITADDTKSPNRITTGAEIISNPLVITGVIGVLAIAAGAIILALNRSKSNGKLDEEVEE